MKTLIAVVAACVPWASGAAAQQLGPCLERGAFVARLFEFYREAPAAMGLTSSGTVLELIESPGGKTWSIIVTLPNGLSCGLVAGEAWQRAPARPPADPPA